MKPVARWFKRSLAAAALLGVVAVAVAWRARSPQPPAPDAWLTQVVERGEIRRTITATGAVTPVSLVQVGTQVSGTIARLRSDFNDQVRAGQLLAELDSTALDAELAQARAQHASALASRDLADSQAARQRRLFELGYATRADLEQALAQASSAEANLDVQKAAWQRAAFNRRNAEIRSPVAGTVISREVSVGQTVAASLQTPVLFKIAQDLREMQIEANVAEADVGMLRTGQPVHFTVDAFPERSFSGSVRQVRNNHTVQQNVVTYTAVIATRSEDLALRPGMTAYISITVAERTRVARIPNAALRYHPAASAAPADSDTPPNRRAVWRLDGTGVPQPVNVTLGLADGRWTELVAGELKPGDRLVIGERTVAPAFGPKIF
jgi:HlyD family secretion protein